MKCEMPRTGARGHGNRRRIIVRQLPAGPVESINEDLVETQVGDEGEPIGGVKVDGVGVRTFLASGIDALPLMLNRRRGFSEPPVVSQRKRSTATAPVVGDEDVLSGRVDDEMARPG